jgi:hypothetical protein
MPFENSGKGYSQLKQFFSSMGPRKGTSLWQTTSFEASAWQIDRRVPEEARDKKWKLNTKKQNGVTQNVQLHHIGQPSSIGAIVMKVDIYSMTFGR